MIQPHDTYCTNNTFLETVNEKDSEGEKAVKCRCFHQSCSNPVATCNAFHSISYTFHYTLGACDRPVRKRLKISISLRLWQALIVATSYRAKVACFQLHQRREKCQYSSRISRDLVHRDRPRGRDGEQVLPVGGS